MISSLHFSNLQSNIEGKKQIQNATINKHIIMIHVQWFIYDSEQNKQKAVFKYIQKSSLKFKNQRKV